MKITPTEFLAIPDHPEGFELRLPVDELRVLSRVVIDELPFSSRSNEEETVVLRQAQWMATHALRGWISGWSSRWRALAIELVEENLSLSARRRVLNELAELKREVDGQADRHLEEVFAQSTLELVTYFTRRRLFP